MDHGSIEITNEERERTVASYWRDEEGWRWESFGDRLPTMTLLKIAGTRVNKNSSITDHAGWLEADSRRFTVKAAYSLLRGMQSTVEWKGWKCIWSLKSQERTKVFLWLLAHDRVMTNWARWRRMIISSPSCGRCAAEKEDALHATRDCKDS